MVSRMTYQVYQQLAKLGVVEHRERYSRSAINGIKILVLTAKGLHVRQHHQPGKPSERNRISSGKIPELLKLLDTIHW